MLSGGKERGEGKTCSGMAKVGGGENDLFGSCQELYRKNIYLLNGLKVGKNGDGRNEENIL